MNMNESIQLHPTRGIDPHLMVCPICGKPTNTISLGHLRAFVDEQDHIIACYSVDGKGGSRQRLIDANPPGLSGFKTRDLREGEKVTDNEPCKECLGELEAHMAFVKAGGVYWKCEECHQGGVIKPSEYATAVRESAKIAAPLACGVIFEHCTEHDDGTAAAN